MNATLIIYMSYEVCALALQCRTLFVFQKYNSVFHDAIYIACKAYCIADILGIISHRLAVVISTLNPCTHCISKVITKISIYVSVGLAWKPGVYLQGVLAAYRLFVICFPLVYYNLKNKTTWYRLLLISVITGYALIAVCCLPILTPSVVPFPGLGYSYNGTLGDIMTDIDYYSDLFNLVATALCYGVIWLYLIRRGGHNIIGRHREKNSRREMRMLLVCFISWLVTATFVLIGAIEVAIGRQNISPPVLEIMHSTILLNFSVTPMLHLILNHQFRCYFFGRVTQSQTNTANSLSHALT